MSRLLSQCIKDFSDRSAMSTACRACVRAPRQATPLCEHLPDAGMLDSHNAWGVYCRHGAKLLRAQALHMTRHVAAASRGYGYVHLREAACTVFRLDAASGLCGERRCDCLAPCAHAVAIHQQTGITAIVHALLAHISKLGAGAIFMHRAKHICSPIRCHKLLCKDALIPLLFHSACQLPWVHHACELLSAKWAVGSFWMCFHSALLCTPHLSVRAAQHVWLILVKR